MMANPDYYDAGRQHFWPLPLDCLSAELADLLTFSGISYVLTTR